MEHELPGSHLGLLQAILKELILQSDPDATFVEQKPDPVFEAEAPSIGH